MSEKESVYFVCEIESVCVCECLCECVCVIVCVSECVCMHTYISTVQWDTNKFLD